MEGPRSNGYIIGLRAFSAKGVPLVEGPGNRHNQRYKDGNGSIDGLVPL
jgi:hypothetical protein